MFHFLFYFSLLSFLIGFSNCHFVLFSFLATQKLVIHFHLWVHHLVSATHLATDGKCYQWWEWDVQDTKRRLLFAFRFFIVTTFLDLMEHQHVTSGLIGDYISTQHHWPHLPLALRTWKEMGRRRREYFFSSSFHMCLNCHIKAHFYCSNFMCARIESRHDQWSLVWVQWIFNRSRDTCDMSCWGPLAQQLLCGLFWNKFELWVYQKIDYLDQITIKFHDLVKKIVFVDCKRNCGLNNNNIMRLSFDLLYTLYR